jgi:hypothetical protein
VRGGGDDDGVEGGVEAYGLECEVFCVRSKGRGVCEEAGAEDACDGGVFLGNGVTEGL